MQNVNYECSFLVIYYFKFLLNLLCIEQKQKFYVNYYKRQRVQKITKYVLLFRVNSKTVLRVPYMIKFVKQFVKFSKYSFFLFNRYFSCFLFHSSIFRKILLRTLLCFYSSKCSFFYFFMLLFLPTDILFINVIGIIGRQTRKFAHMSSIQFSYSSSIFVIISITQLLMCVVLFFFLQKKERKNL